jgi:hypothetical protein
MAEQPVRIISQPGIKRDGTLLQGENYVDGQWCRWASGLPRKMWGYRRMTQQLDGIVYGLHSFAVDSTLYIHTGTSAKLKQFQSDYSANVGIPIDRTPGGFVTNTSYVWTFDVVYDTATNVNKLVAHVAPNLACICSSTQGQIYIGDLLGSSALTAVTVPVGESVSGGIMVLHPYLVAYGSSGNVTWSVSGNPSDLSGAGSGSAHVAGQKLIAGAVMRAGPGNSPAGLLWSPNELVRMAFVGGTSVWSFDTLSTSTSLISSRAVVEYDGVFYWAGNGRFFMFNGVVREIPNQLNTDWFFDGMNPAKRQKIFGFINPRWGEIWWCYPRGDATECTHAVIFNVREGTWYDTQLANSGRSSAAFDPVFRYPMMTGVDIGDTSEYKLWQHEYGLDELDGGTTEPIPSYFETGEMAMFTGQQPKNGGLHVAMLEPDFVQAGDMTVQAIMRANVRSPERTSAVKTFSAVAATPAEELVDFKDTARLMRFRFESNAAGGDYWMGETYAQIGPGDGRMRS